ATSHANHSDCLLGAGPGHAGLVQNIARPEGNITGFPALEPSLAGKWLELLKEASPRIARVALIFNAELSVGSLASYLATIEAAAPVLGVRPTRTPIRTAVAIVRALDALAVEPTGGLLILPPPPTTAIRDAILQLASQHRLPSIYPSVGDAVAGGLLAY